MSTGVPLEPIVAMGAWFIGPSHFTPPPYSMLLRFGWVCAKQGNIRDGLPILHFSVVTQMFKRCQFWYRCAAWRQCCAGVGRFVPDPVPYPVPYRSMPVQALDHPCTTFGPLPGEQLAGSHIDCSWAILCAWVMGAENLARGDTI
jgi:hypothetical protein